MATIPLQTTFNTVVEHLRKQGKKSIGTDLDCLYRGPNGLMCAAGCLIPDSRYKESFEGDAIWSELPKHSKSSISDLIFELGHDLKLVSKLQSAHDDTAPEDWETEFEDIASLLKLTYTPPVPA